MRQYMINHTVAKLTWDRAHIQDHSFVNIAGNDQCADSEFERGKLQIRAIVIL